MTSPNAAIDFAGLVERLVPQVAELFATLATRDPLRMYFADIAGKTVLDIVEVLRSDGISQEAIAASLGLTMGGFRARLRKLRELYRETPGNGGAAARPPRTLLETVYAFVDDRGDTGGAVTYRQLTDRFRTLKADTLKGVLHFLVSYGLLSVTGRGAARRYRVVHQPPSAAIGPAHASVLLFHEGPLTLAQLAQRLGETESACEALLAPLRATGHLVVGADVAGEATYRVCDYHIPIGTAAGYEAALWDHVSAVLRAVCKKVRLGRHSASMGDVLGGTTFAFDVAVGSELEAEIAGFLARSRAQMEDWLARARAGEAEPAAARRRITIYTGQMVEDLS